MKKPIAILLAGLFVAVTAACGGTENNSAALQRLEAENASLVQENSALKEQIATLEAQIAALEAQVNKITDTSTQLEEETPKEPRFTKVNLGDTVTLDFAELTFESAAWSDDIKPTDTSGVYSYMSDEEGESYFWLCGTLKNTSGEKFNVDNTYGEIVFDNKYSYTAYLIADDGGNDFFGDTVKPLKTIKYYIYASCPDEIKESYSSAVVNFAFKDNFAYEYKSDWTLYDNLFTISLSA